MIFQSPTIKFHRFYREKTCARFPGRLGGTILAMGFFLICHTQAQEPATNATASTPPSAAEAARDLLNRSSQDLIDGDWDQAIRDASLAIQLDPHNASAYELRGSVYVQEKLWDRAERDYTTANQVCPDAVYKYKLAEIKFIQKAYDDARLRFAALEGDARLGDLALYKVFLCDLLGGHEALSDRELAALDAAEKKPSYYYGHTAWNLIHNQRAEANKWRTAAQKLYDNSTDQLYILSLFEAENFRPDVATFITKDGSEHDRASVFLENTGLRTLTPQGWTTLPLDQLPDDLTAFPNELREQISKQRAALSTVESPTPPLSFTTRSGKRYDRVRWSLETDGILVLTTDGWIDLPFAQLPDDLSGFPADLKQTARQKRQSVPTISSQDDLVSFTTKRGKKYDQAKTSLTDDGLRTLTPDGWITIPFSELPDDLSVFPARWRDQMLASHSARRDDPLGMKFVTFTTRKGKQYTQVRAAMEGTGLRLLTSQGWIPVPFNQLPIDLSVFPEEWRENIRNHQKN